MSSRWTGFFIWALVAASTAFWGIRIFAATRPVPLSAQAPLAAIPPSGPMERLFGAIVVPTAAAEVQHPESDRFQLVGVIAPRGAADREGGLAIVAIDGQPAKPWHIGATLDGNTTLLAVAKRTADFGPPGGPSAFTLQLPEPSTAETGSLPVAVSQPGNSTQAPPAYQRENAQHVAQPPNPAFPQRGSQNFSRPLQRGMPPPADGVPPGRVAPAPGPGTAQQPAQEGVRRPDAE